MEKNSEWASIASEAMFKLRNGFFDSKWVNMFIQDDYMGRKFDIIDGYIWAALWHDLAMGEMLVTFIDVGECPGPDKGEKNKRVLDELGKQTYKSLVDGAPLRISASWDGSNHIGDGDLKWSPEMIFDKLHNSNPESLVTIPSRSVPLEVGSTKLTTTFWHLNMSRGLARWPYGSTEIGIFVRPDDWVSPLDR